MTKISETIPETILVNVPDCIDTIEFYDERGLVFAKHSKTQEVKLELEKSTLKVILKSKLAHSFTDHEQGAQRSGHADNRNDRGQVEPFRNDK